MTRRISFNIILGNELCQCGEERLDSLLTNSGESALKRRTF